MKQTVLQIFFCISCIFYFSSQLFSQSWDEIKTSNQYFWGEGLGDTRETAKINAYDELLSSISVSVISETGTQGSIIATNGDVIGSSSFTSSVKTLKQMTLTNLHWLDIEAEPNARVGCFLPKSELDALFKYRRDRAFKLFDDAEKEGTKGHIDTALKYYYWGLSLIASLQYPSKESYDGHLVVDWVPDQIRQILRDIEVKIGPREGNFVNLFFTYQGKPVSTLAFNYDDDAYSVKDGIAQIELSTGNNPQQYQIGIEYKFQNQANGESEMKQIIEMGAQMMSFGESVKFVSAHQKPTSVSAASFAQPKAYQRPTEVTDKVDYLQIANRIVSALKSGDYNAVSPYFTAKGIAEYRKLIQYGKARVLGEPQWEFLPYQDRVVCRGLRMSFSFPNGARRSFTENVVFTFDANQKIDNVNFGLDLTTSDNILGNNAIPELVRKQLMEFLENYQTAYALKELDYLRTIFDDDAIIWTGRVLKTKAGQIDDNGNITLAGEKISYNRFSKDEFLEHLKTTFATKAYINICFNTCDVRKFNHGGEIYGIQIEQDYFSSNYSDHGFLFLMLDLNNPEQPLIKVRTWQPKRDPKFGYYSIDDFVIMDRDSNWTPSN